MKIRTLSGTLAVALLTLLLIGVVLLIPPGLLRVILGIPFLLFFPGYALLAALFINKQGIGGLEQLALSCVISIAVVALIGFGLNFTAWGITLEPVLYSIAIFTILMSTIAIIRGASLIKDATLTLKSAVKLSNWGGSTFQSTFYVVLIVSILSAMGLLGYNLATINTSDRYTEFYILGQDGKAQDYPGSFMMRDGKSVMTQYGNNGSYTFGGTARILVGIVNHEQQKSTYSLKIKIDGKLVKINYQDSQVGEVTGISLMPGEKWEKPIGFTPEHPGDHQKVEILLFKNGSSVQDDSLQLLIDVVESK
jgi:uncharacterized membrane protein